MTDHETPYRLFLLIEYGDCWILQKSIDGKYSGVTFEPNNGKPADRILVDFFQAVFNQNIIFLDYWNVEQADNHDHMVFLGRIYDCNKQCLKDDYRIFGIEEIPDNPLIDQFAAKLITKNINKLRGVIR
jgi:hypothetical protein